MRNEHVFLAATTHKGKGMFCKQSIPANTVIEIAPVIVMTAEDRIHLDKTLLHDYIFEWHPNGVQMCCMALGSVPIYNHSYQSNCEYFMDYDAEEIHIVSVRDIAAGEELTINYNGDWNDEKPVWFEVKK